MLGGALSVVEAFLDVSQLDVVHAEPGGEEIVDLVGGVGDDLLAADDEIYFFVHGVDSVSETGAVVWAELAGIFADASDVAGLREHATNRGDERGHAGEAAELSEGSHKSC